MRFTILSHAGLLVEESGKSLVVDPWLKGSCYWRSWWNFPEPDPDLIASLKPDYIYITHLHWDHFQGPSLRLFSKDTPILVPLVQTRRMVKDLNDLGFKNVHEIPHGESFHLAENFELFSYQFGFCVDSAIVLKGKKTTLFNANDAKIFGLPLKQIQNRFPHFDFVFRSHSSASGIPYCIENYQTRFHEFRTEQDYMNEFANFALHVKADYAIPFASNHCFLHKEAFAFNNTSVSPDRVKANLNALAESTNSHTRAVVMPPGSIWDETSGFKIKEFDYNKKAEYVATLSKKYADKLELEYAIEAKVHADQKAFFAYFDRYLHALPLAIRLQKKTKILFKVLEQNVVHFWAVDYGSLKAEVVSPTYKADITIECHARVINDCTRKDMFSVWTASKRLKILLEKDENLSDLKLFFTLLDLFESDCLPLYKNFSVRSLGVRIRRWREAVEFLCLAFTTKILKRPLVVSDLYPVERAHRPSHRS